MLNVILRTLLGIFLGTICEALIGWLTFEVGGLLFDGASPSLGTAAWSSPARRATLYVSSTAPNQIRSLHTPESTMK